jgi:hypothetical protein
MIRSCAIILLCLALFSAGSVEAFTAPQPAITSGSRLSTLCSNSDRSFVVLNMAPKDPSRSGSKTERMNRLADMQEQGSANTDSSVFVYAAGGLVAFIVVAIAAAAASGLLTQY